MLKNQVSPDDHIQGRTNALITLVEYGDYQCPYCGLAYPIVKALQNHFDDQLCFVFRNFPLTEVHPLAEPAAECAEFAATQNRFWEMHDLLYENQGRFNHPLFQELGQILKLPVEDLEQAIENKAFESKIRKDFIGGVKSGVNGTPTFFMNEQRYNGPVEFQSMVSAIESLLTLK
jgi:protein-disulfide isomerase